MGSLFLKGLYDPFGESRDVANECFVCGALLDSSNRTKEHVYPQWLIGWAGLTGESITSPYLGRKIPYTNLTVPACRTCNTRHLQMLEKKIQKAFTKATIDEHDATDEEIAVWTAKLLYSTLLHDYIHSSGDQKEALGETLCADDYQIMHAAIQTLLGKIHFNAPGQLPVSLRAFPVKVPSHPRDRFGLTTNTASGAMALRINHLGLLVSFDAGYMSIFGGHYFDQYGGRRLHPTQFEELAAHWLYMSQLQLGTIPFGRRVDESGNILIRYLYEDSINLHMMKMGTLPPFGEQVTSDFRLQLSATTHLRIDQLGEGDLCPTWQVDPVTGQYKEMDVDGPRF